MAAARDDILAALRRARIAPTPPPESRGEWTRYADPVAQFASMVRAAGGECVEDDLQSSLESSATFRAAKRIAATIPGVARANVDLAAIADPHDLDGVDFAVIGGELGVAENGAVWVTDRGVKHRALFFLAQHLAIVLDRAAIVDHMHAAYARIALPRDAFGCFVSGPSKTADIEQALVIGAHGPRSLLVVLR